MNLQFSKESGILTLSFLMSIILCLSTTTLAIFRLVFPNKWRLIEIDFMGFSHEYLVLTYKRQAFIKLS